MEEKESSGSPHRGNKKRQTGRVTGVKEVDSFSEEEILLQTEEGEASGERIRSSYPVS